MTNGQVFEAVVAMRELCAPQNRLGSIPARLKAVRTLASLEAAWAPCETLRSELVMEHGEEREDGIVAVVPGSDGWDAFVAAYGAMMEEEADAKVEPIRLADIDSGYSKDADGKKEPVDIDGPSLAVLITLGLITE